MYLERLDDATKVIPLTTGRGTVLGRGEVTGVTDRRCSRRQASIMWDADNSVMRLICLGVNPVGLHRGGAGCATLVTRECPSTVLVGGDSIALIPGCAAVWRFVMPTIPVIHLDDSSDGVDAVAPTTTSTATTTSGASPSSKRDRTSSSSVTAGHGESPVKRRCARADEDTRVLCRYGPLCRRRAPEHFERFAHPWRDAKRASQAVRMRSLGTSVASKDTPVTTRSPYDPSHYEPVFSLTFNADRHSGHLIVGTCDTLALSDRIAAFDLDSTLIRTRSGRTFATSSHDWQWWSDVVPDRLRQLHYEEGFKVVVFTNQAGIARSAGKAETLKVKLRSVCDDLGFPFEVYMAAGKDQWRKPSPLMWRRCLQANPGVKPDLCFYVGDAAGRAAGWKRGSKRDFSDSDRKFALNCGIAFHTPEAFFHNEDEAPFDWSGMDGSHVLQTYAVLDTGLRGPYHRDSPEVVVFVGSPASGKTTFANKWFVPYGYEWINRDTLHSQERCVAAARAAVEGGRSVVVDNTNPQRNKREAYIRLAQQHGWSVRCFVFDVPLHIARHLNAVRVVYTEGERGLLPDVAFNMFRTRLQAPSETEGFDEIVRVPFVPTFEGVDGQRLKQCFSMRL